MQTPRRTRRPSTPSWARPSSPRSTGRPSPSSFPSSAAASAIATSRPNESAASSSITCASSSSRQQTSSLSSKNSFQSSSASRRKSQFPRSAPTAPRPRRPLSRPSRMAAARFPRSTYKSQPRGSIRRSLPILVVGLHSRESSGPLHSARLRDVAGSQATSVGPIAFPADEDTARSPASPCASLPFAAWNCRASLPSSNSSHCRSTVVVFLAIS
mmetsp:Transcript_18452/g.58089  ORF Transcript_18452/g.58089 Transcript_18452/m.58089 type:complete len:214 (-) Transcript_18452:22-663(-)